MRNGRHELLGFAKRRARPRPGSAVDSPGSLVWVDRTGRQTPTGAPPHVYSGPRLSPDGTRIAVAIGDRENDIHCLRSQERDPDPADLRVRVSNRVRFGLRMGDGWCSRRTGREGESLRARGRRGWDGRTPTTPPDAQPPAWVAPDGSGILAMEISPKTAGDIIWFPIGTLRVEPVDLWCRAGTPAARETLGIDLFPEVSPDGRFMAYQSNESGRNESTFGRFLGWTTACGRCPSTAVSSQPGLGTDGNCSTSTQLTRSSRYPSDVGDNVRLW